MRVGINGFGRIGKAITRINLEKKAFDLVMINDINPDAGNLAYQLKYDSIYGTLDNEITTNGCALNIDGEKIMIQNRDSIEAVPWILGHVDLVIDCSGVHQNVIRAKELQSKNIKHCIVTHSPDFHYAKPIIVGVNEKTLEKEDFMISSSICDANAVSPVLQVLDARFGISHGFITTLHPWLNYQNLLDGQSKSFGYPGTTYGRYELGRACTDSLIPKPTSCVTAMEYVLPNLKNKFLSMSYRVPTDVVATADISVKLDKTVSKQTIHNALKDKIRFQRYKILTFNDEPLVSTDFIKSNYSAIVDRRWTMVNNDNYAKLVLWYDNEWGYSNRVVDLVEYLGGLK